MISLALPLFYLTKLLLIVLTMKYETNLSLVSVALVLFRLFKLILPALCFVGDTLFTAPAAYRVNSVHSTAKVTLFMISVVH